MNENLKIEIRQVPNRQGISDFSKNLEYFSQVHTIAPFVNPKTLKYETGLTTEDIEYLKKENCPYDLSPQYTKDVPHPFWESSLVKVDLSPTPMFLFPYRNYIDFIKWKYLKVNSYIYNSEEEMLSGGKPEATHYIFNEEEHNSIAASKVEKRNANIQKISKLSLERKRNILFLIEGENTDNKNENYLTVKFEEILQDATKTEKLTEFLSKKEEDLSTLILVRKGVEKSILKKTAKGIFFLETNLGISIESVVEKLLLPENQEIYTELKNKI